MRGHYPRISRFTTNLHSPQKRPRISANALLGMWLIIYFEVVIRICKSLIKFRASFKNTMQRYIILSIWKNKMRKSEKCQYIFLSFHNNMLNYLYFCSVQVEATPATVNRTNNI